MPNTFPDEALLELKVNLSGLNLGVVKVVGIKDTSPDATLTREINARCAQVHKLYSLGALYIWEPIWAVRGMFRLWGVDPSKYRPSAESLLRRVARGKGFPRISNSVDAGNLGAIEMGWPYGCYDLEKITGAIEIRRGNRGEEYESIGRRVFCLEGRPVFSDSVGPFGSPIVDSRRTMITEVTKQVLVLICAPERSSRAMLQVAVSRLVGRLARWCKGAAVTTKIINAVNHRCAPESRSLACDTSVVETTSFDILASSSENLRGQRT